MRKGGGGGGGVRHFIGGELTDKSRINKSCRLISQEDDFMGIIL